MRQCQQEPRGKRPLWMTPSAHATPTTVTSWRELRAENDALRRDSWGCSNSWVVPIARVATSRAHFLALTIRIVE